MKQQKLPRKYYGTCKRNVQERIDEVFAEKEIPADDSVRLIDQIVEEMDVSPLMRAYSDTGRKPATSSRTLFKVMIYAGMEHIYSSRNIRKACLRDINFIWLLDGEEAPSYHNSLFIKVNPGRREVSPEPVAELAKSITTVGLLNPVALAGDYTLVAGLHRLKAVKLLGWTEVECTITDLEGLSAELSELDEDFVKANLSPLEMGDLLKRRKDIYEELYPETKVGTTQAIGTNKAKGNNVNCNLQSTRNIFIENTADVTDSHPSTIARHIKIASELAPEAKEILRGAKKPVSSSALKKISKLSPSQQQEASSLLVSGEIQTVQEDRSPHVRGSISGILGRCLAR